MSQGILAMLIYIVVMVIVSRTSAPSVIGDDPAAPCMYVLAS